MIVGNVQSLSVQEYLRLLKFDKAANVNDRNIILRWQQRKVLSGGTQDYDIILNIGILPLWQINHWGKGAS